MAARVVAVSSREATTTQTVSCDEHGILRFVLNDDPKVEQLAGLAADSRTRAQKHDALLAWLCRRVDALESEVRRMESRLDQREGD